MIGAFFSWVLLLSGVLFASCSCPVHADDGVYAVGVAKVDITPTYPVRLNGFGYRREESEGITQRIWAKALAIGGDDQKPLVLVTLDSLGVRLSMVEEVAARLKQKAAVERDRFAVTFSHSHTTPKVEGAADTIFSTPIPPEHQKRISRYTRELTDAIEQVALAALADRQPSRLEWGVGEVGFAKNRRTPGGPVDHSLPTLIVRSIDDNKIRAIYTTYACHCVSLNDNKISGDWAGYAQRALEVKHPHAIALVSIGCGSDANPISRVTPTHPTAAFDQGAEIADGVEQILETGSMKPITGPTTATLNHIALPLEPPPSREALEKLAASDGPDAFNAQFQLARLDQGEPLMTEINYPIQTWTFGDSLSMVFLAGEVCVDYSLRLKQELDGARLWPHGYSNDFCCYIPSERLLREGGYGGGGEIRYFALPSKLAPGLEEKIVDEVLRQVPQQFHVEPLGNQESPHQDKTGSRNPASVSDAQASSFQLSKEFVIELVAAEPLVVDPVAIDFAPDGNLWVVEMPDYSQEADAQFVQHGTVKLLSDRNGDGRFDEATALVSDLRFPTDVKVWGDGVIVCDAPVVLYIEDTDGDGRADIRKTLLTGFATHNPQARVNCLRWGLDNWLYGSCGLFGGNIKSFSGRELELGARDFRFRPDTGEIEPVTGRTQQGRSRDDWGNWFGCRNSSLALHYPLDERYLSRNPFVVPPAYEMFVPAGPNPNQLFPICKQTLFEKSGPPGRPTSVCGLGIYRDDLLGNDLAGNLFVAEPVGGLIHRLVLSPRGTTFSGVRAPEEQRREFLASVDSWFRPVQIRTGLDGCLWIVDMHRAVIEHKRFIPAETLRETDVMAGSDQGRIFRIRPRNQLPRPIEQLDRMDGACLAATLNSPNGPLRDLAHQMIVHRQAKDAVPVLEELAQTSERPATRLQAIAALDGIDALRPALVVRALADPDPNIRRHAIRLAEPLLNDDAEVASALQKLLGDNEPLVVLQLAYTLGEWDAPCAAESQAAIMNQHADDPYLLAATLSSLNHGNIASTVHSVLASVGPEGLALSLAEPLMTSVAHLGDLELASQTLATLSPIPGDDPSEWRLTAIASLLEALRNTPQGAAVFDDQSFEDCIKQLAAIADDLLDDLDSNPGQVIAAARVLLASSSDPDELVDRFAALVSPQHPPAVQQAGIDLLTTINSSDARAALLAHWNGLTPAIRAEFVETFLVQEGAVKQFLAGIAAGDVKLQHLDAVARQQLLNHPAEECRKEAQRLLAGAINTNRAKVLKSYTQVEQMRGDSSHGREIFHKHCANCHKLEGDGYAVGPDLTALTNRSPEMFLESVFDPNRTVDERYQTYLALTDEGLAQTGILAGESSHSITLLSQQGIERTLLRRSLETFENTGISLMPEGFEKDLSAQDAADLLAYIDSQNTSLLNQ